MASFLSSISQVMTAALSWIGSILNFVVSEPALLVLCIAMPVIGFAVGLFRRLIYS